MTLGVMGFGALMLLTLLAGGLPLPWRVAGPLLGAASIVYGVRVIARVRRLQWRGLLTPMLVFGLVLTGVTTFASTVHLAGNWDVEVARQQCLERSVTIAAKERCEREYLEAITPTGS